MTKALAASLAACCSAAWISASCWVIDASCVSSAVLFILLAPSGSLVSNPMPRGWTQAIALPTFRLKRDIKRVGKLGLSLGRSFPPFHLLFDGRGEGFAVHREP